MALNCIYCGGPVGFDNDLCKMVCYVCQSIQPPEYVEAQTQIKTVTYPLSDYDECLGNADDFLTDEDDFYPDIDAVSDTDEDVNIPEPVYQEKSEQPVIIMEDKRMNKGQIRCAYCNKTKAERGNPLKRLYGPNKDMCLTCFKKYKTGKLKKAKPQKNIQPALQVDKATETYAIFNNKNEFVGRYSQQEMLSNVTPGCTVYKMTPVTLTVKVEFSD